MSQESHTAGPFSIAVNDDELFIVAPDPKLPGCIGMVAQIFEFDFPGQAAANARLFAAGPKLLAALKALTSIPLFPLERDRAAFDRAANLAAEAINQAEVE